MKDCRACLAQAIDKNCVNIKTQVTDEIDVLQAINEVTSLEGSHYDFLPKFICKKCFKLLKSTTVFRRKIIHSYGQLMSKLKSNVSITCLEVLTANDDENIIKIEEVFLPEGSQDIKTGKECTPVNVRSQICNVVENQVYSVQINCDMSSSPPAAVTRNTRKFINQQNIGEYENEIEEENIKLNKLLKSVKKKRKSEKNTHNFELELHGKEAEPTEIASKNVLEINTQECALKELGDGVKHSSQKAEKGTYKAVDLRGNEAGKSKSKTNTLGTQTCTVCGIMLKGKKKYNLHMKAHTSDLLPSLEYGCPICPKRYPKKEYLLVHTRSHTGEKPYHCDICDKNFSQFATYHVHKKRLHDKVIQGTCSYCGKMFVDKPELDVHIKTWHTGQEKNTFCAICDRRFKSQGGFLEHVKWIHNKTENKCEHCNKVFQKKFNLNRHLIVCATKRGIERPYNYCCLCDFRDLKKSNVIVHYETCHGITMARKSLDFQRWDDFLEWKAIVENATNSQFNKIGTRMLKSVKKYRFACHRDGYFQSQSEQIRHTKVLDSIKINGHCPAKIIAQVSDDGSVKVNCIDTHVGHNLEEIGRKNAMPLSKPSDDCERPYLCEFCSATFVCNRTLQRHRKEIHSEKKPCQKCGKMLGDYALKKHLVRHQVVEEGLKIVRKKYTCEYCKTVMNFTSRRRHLERQHGIKLHGRGDDCTKVPVKETGEKEGSISPGIP